jgi:hypothetical protein
MQQSSDRRPTDSVRTYVERLISKLLGYAKAGGCADWELDEARLALECLPLTTEEFATATTRLANARRYLAAGEHGAFAFELRLLAGGLANKSVIGPRGFRRSSLPEASSQANRVRA